MFLWKKSVALHTLQNICPKSSNFENYYALICFLYNINMIILTETETETVAYIKMAPGAALSNSLEPISLLFVR